MEMAMLASGPRPKEGEIYCAGPIVSAIVAPRVPSGFSRPTVVSRAVWCSISELISAPRRMAIADIHIHVIGSDGGAE
jgi:hypothetical protein